MNLGIDKPKIQVAQLSDFILFQFLSALSSYDCRVKLF